MRRILEALRRRFWSARRRVFEALEGAGDKSAAAVMRDTGLGSGTVYSVLIVAEERGAVVSRWGAPAYDGAPRPVLYTLTAAGRLELEALR